MVDMFPLTLLFNAFPVHFLIFYSKLVVEHFHLNKNCYNVYIGNISFIQCCGFCLSRRSRLTCIFTHIQTNTHTRICNICTHSQVCMQVSLQKRFMCVSFVSKASHICCLFGADNRTCLRTKAI